MRPLHILLLLAVLGCSTPRPSETGQSQNFYLGTYNDPGTHEPGIYHFTLRADGSLINNGRAAEANNPSFLAYTPDRGHLLAVEEQGGERRGNLIAFTVNRDRLTDPQRQAVSGGGPCHVNSNAEGYITVATYAGGTLELFRLEDGVLTPRLDLQDHRQRGDEEPHTHSSYYLDGGREVLAVDLGTDEVWHYRLDPSSQKLAPASPPAIPMQEGAGPRHLDLHPNGKWIYVINELNSTVTQLERRDDGIRVVSSWSTLPDDFTGENYCADIHVSSDGRFVYGSNRGHNSVVVYAVDQRSGSLTPLEYEAVAGDWPRNLALSPDERYLLVANQRSKNITTLARSEKTGMLDYVTSTEAPIPVCIRF
jgi:6-phosphogluconolactonase